MNIKQTREKIKELEKEKENIEKRISELKQVFKYELSDNVYLVIPQNPIMRPSLHFNDGYGEPCSKTLEDTNLINLRAVINDYLESLEEEEEEIANLDDIFF